MPPRRSSRATSASYEAPPVESAPAKRKRGQTADADAEEKENVAKPSSRTRRPSSTRSSVAPPSRSRVASRSKAPLPDLAESDNEEHSDAPPQKKARPSIEAKGEIKVEDEEEEEEEEKLKKTRRGASGRPTRRAVDMDIDEDEQAPSTSASRRTSRSAASSASKASGGSARSGEASGSARVEDDEEEEEEEVVKPTKGRRGAAKRAPSKQIQPDDEDEEEMPEPSDDEDEEDKKPVRRGRKPKAPAVRKGKVPAKKAAKPVVVEESDDELEPPTPAQPRRKSTQPEASQPPATSEPVEEEEEEEEKSLFEPPPMPPPSSLPQAMPEEPSGPKARLVIHKMALVNFKSYAGRQEIGPFHKSFSAIVGPNGSGKSNTIDALLFVFGYRASKMRQGKISELIHNSANFPDLEECSVEVHFRDILDLPGTDAFKVVPGTQLVVTRTAYKNNSSKYTINGRTSSYSEVQTLLKGRGIDLDHNRFLILQGEVESIAQMKPKAPTEHEDGLLEYLEDIIGTSKYKEPIDEAMVEMERLQEDRQIKMNRLRHVEKEKAALEERKKEAEDYLRLKNEYVKARSREYQWFLWKLFEAEKKLELQIKKLQKDLEKETEQHKDDIAHLELLREHHAGAEKLYQEVQAAAKGAVKDLAQFERQEIGLQEKRKHTSGRVKKLKKTITDETTAQKTATETVKDSSAKMKKETQKLEEFNIQLEEEEKILEGIRDSLKDKTQVFHDKIQVKQKELQPWTAQINEKQAQIDVATGERDALKKKADALKQQLEEAEQIFNTLQTELQGKVEHQNDLRAEKGQLRKDIQTAENRVKNAQGSVREWGDKARTSKGKVNEAKASQSENRSRNNVLESLTRLKDAGNIDGFHGRLGNLGTIADKYDVAISTACGGPLSNMVVDKVAQAQACIEYLRKNSVGRASFMVLEKIQSERGMEPIQTPEGVPRLFDLIKPKDPKYRPAFYKAVRDTLVANDMEQANRIAFGARRYRVVTLDGALIETSGAMSGGGGAPSKGAMSSKFAAASVSPQVLQGYERDSEQAAQNFQRAEAELREAEADLERLKRRDPEIDLAYEKLVMDIENTKRRIAEAEKRVKELSSQKKPNTGDVARIAKLQNDIDAYESELSKVQEKTGRIEQDIKDLEKKILEVGGSKLLSQKSKVDGIKVHIGLASDEITRAEVNKGKAEKDLVKLEGTIAANTATLEELEEEITELDANLADITKVVNDLKEKVDAAQAAVDNKKDDLEARKAELDEKEEQVAEFRQREMKIKQSLSDAEKEMKHVDEGIKEYETLHEELKLEEIEGDDDDDDDEDAGQEDQAMDEDQSVKADGDVKPEPGDKPERERKGKAPREELAVLSEDELRKFKKEELVADVAHLEEQLARARPDMTVLKEYKQREQEFLNRAQDLENITAERDTQKAKYDGLRKQRLDEFMAGFNLISLKLKEMYQMITLGGNAELELVDSMDPFSEGIIFSVMPPKKSWKNISNLSGGEKTLSSLALVFALHVFKPTPLYFMDEIDAALDFRNVSIVANYIKDRTKNAQFIIISLRNDMFELSHRLIGIYKTSNQTRSISIDNHTLQAAIPVAPRTAQATA